MANKIYLEYSSYEDESGFHDSSDIRNTTSSYMIANSNVLELPLLDDPKIDSQSHFTSWNEMLPSIVSETLNNVSNIQSGITGTIGAGLLDLKNKFDLPKWSKTDPITLNVTLGFFTKTNSYRDVYLPAKQIIGLSILSKDPNDENLYRVPGISLNTAKEYDLQAKNNTNSSPTVDSLKAKLIAFEIPGVIYVPLAYVAQAVPTYSKHLTEQSLPYWCHLDCMLVSISPATTEMYNDASISNRAWLLTNNFQAAKSTSKILG